MPLEGTEAILYQIETEYSGEGLQMATDAIERFVAVGLTINEAAEKLAEVYARVTAELQQGTQATNENAQATEASGEKSKQAGEKMDQAGKKATSSWKEMNKELAFLHYNIEHALSLIGDVEAFAKQGAAINTMIQIYQRLGQESGINSDKLLEDMERATAGTVDRFTMMQAANRALLAGGADIAEHLPELFRIASAAAMATGQDVTYITETLVKGIVKASPLLIDNAEIYIKVGQAVDKYAASLGKTTEQLSAAERQQAVLQAVLQEGETYVARIGDTADSSAAAFMRFDVAIQNNKRSLQTWAAEAARPAIDVLTEFLSGNDQINTQLIKQSKNYEDYQQWAGRAYVGVHILTEAQYEYAKALLASGEAQLHYNELVAGAAPPIMVGPDPLEVALKYKAMAEEQAKVGEQEADTVAQTRAKIIAEFSDMWETREKIAKEYSHRLEDINKDHAKRLADIAEEERAAEADAQEKALAATADYIDKRNEAESNFARDEGRQEADHLEQMAQERQDYQEKVTDAERSFQEKLSEMAYDYATRRQEMVEGQQEALGRTNTAKEYEQLLAKQQRELSRYDQEYKHRVATATTEHDEQMSQMERDYNERKQREEAHYQEERARRQADNNQRLSDMDKAHQQELVKIDEQEKKRLAELGKQRADENANYKDRQKDLVLYLDDSMEKFAKYDEDLNKAHAIAVNLRTEDEKDKLLAFLDWVRDVFIPERDKILAPPVSPGAVVSAITSTLFGTPTSQQAGGPVTRDQVAMLHAGEYVVPRGGVLVREVPGPTRGAAGGGTRTVKLEIPLILDSKTIYKATRSLIWDDLDPDSFKVGPG
jgi:hypothetical protein